MKSYNTMSQMAKYNSVSLKVNMKKSIIKKEDLLRKKADLVRRKLTTLARSFDKLERVLRMPRATSSTQGYPISSEYNLIIAAQKDFCAKLIKAINVIGNLDKKFNEHLDRNEVDTNEISRGVEDLVDKLEKGVIHLPPPGVPFSLNSPINFVSPVGQ